MNEDMLRRILNDEASRVQIAPDALGTIRTKIAARRSRWWPTPRLFYRPRGGAMFAISTGTGVAVAATVVAVFTSVGSCAPVPVTSGGPPGSTISSTAPVTSPPPSGTPAATVANVPIYYLGATKAGPMLYREYHRIPVGDGSTAAKIKAALAQMLDGRTAYDSDYSSQWPASAAVRGVTVSGGVATVDLSGATVNAKEPVGNRAAVQQLIWTATAFTGGTGVKLLFDGAPRTTLWGTVNVAGTLHRAAADTTLAPVWVIDPQAKSVSGTSVTVHLAGIVFEGTIQLRIRNSSGTVIKQQTVQLTVGAPAQGTATVHLTLAPGSYTVEAYEVSLKDSSIVALDGHPFTVQ